MQFILKSLQEIYHDSERKFALGNESLLAHRKWASSSDLVHGDQDKNNITLTPVSQIRIMKSPSKRTPSPSIDTSSSEPNLVYNGSSSLTTTPEQLMVSRFDKSILSPISDIEPPGSLPRKRVTHDDDLQSSLRRRSYRRAIASDDPANALPGAVERDRSASERHPMSKRSDSRRRSRSEGPLIISSVDGASPSEARVIYQGEQSNSTSSLRASDSANQKHLRAVAESRHRHGNDGSLPRRNNSSLITDRSRTSSPERTSPPRPSTPKPPSPLASVDSPRSSPRSSSSSSTKFLNPATGHVVRSPSRTSSSSSGSEESWHSVASSVEGGRRRVRKMPRTPSPEPDRRLGSG